LRDELPNSQDRMSSAKLQLVFPNSYDTYTLLLQKLANSPISQTIASQFCFPKSAVHARHVPASSAAMPETAVNEYSHAGAPEEEVRTAGNVSGQKFPSHNTGRH
jgi:hypothetical protein